MYCLTFTHIFYKLIVNNYSAIDVYPIRKALRAVKKLAPLVLSASKVLITS